MGALTGENTMKANVGETVLFVHSQADRQSFPHLIGGPAIMFGKGATLPILPGKP